MAMPGLQRFIPSLFRSSINLISMFIILKMDYLLLWFLYKRDFCRQAYYNNNKKVSRVQVWMSIVIFVWRVTWFYTNSPFNDIKYFYRSWKVYFLAHSTQILNNLKQSRFKHLYVTYFYQTITLRDVTQKGFPLKLIASTWEEVGRFFKFLLKLHCVIYDRWR